MLITFSQSVLDSKVLFLYKNPSWNKSFLVSDDIRKDFFIKEKMKNTESFYTTSSIAEIENAINELKTVTDEDLFQGFLDNSSLVFYKVDDKTKQFALCVEELLTRLKKALKREMNKDFAVEILTEFLNDKKEFKSPADSGWRSEYGHSD